MSRKGENIHRRKDGRWEARILQLDDFGVRKQKSLYGKTYREAKEKLLNARKEDLLQKKRREEKKVSDVALEWLTLNQMNQKGATHLKYQTIIEKHINPTLGDMKIYALDESIINIFLTKKLNRNSQDHETERGLSGSYVKTMGTILNSIIKYSVNMGYRYPLKAKIVKPCEAKIELPVMDLYSQIKLEAFICKDYSATSTGIILALQAGLRIGEICALKWEEIDLEAGIIHVRHTVARVVNHDTDAVSVTKLIIDMPKTKTSNRDIPMNSKLMEYLRRARQVTKSEYVVSEKEIFVSPRTFEYRYHKLLQKNGIPDINFHALRHTFATRCVEVGMDVKTLSEILGHANVGITLNTYVHSSIDLKRNQLEKLTQLDFC